MVQTTSTSKQLRVYPTCCTSAYCGKLPESCPSCRNFPVLQEFKAWKVEHDAVREDVTWCPSVWTARR